MRLRRLRPADLQAYCGGPEVGRWQGWQLRIDARNAQRCRQRVQQRLTSGYKNGAADGPSSLV